jgi:hypothetical protein
MKTHTGGGVYVINPQLLTKPSLLIETFNFFREHSMQNPYLQLIETICNDVLPNMVRIYESKKLSGALDQDHFITLLEQKIELANKSLKVLSAEEQITYRAKIDRAYAENIDRLRNDMSVRKTPCLQNVPVDHC